MAGVVFLILGAISALASGQVVFKRELEREQQARLASEARETAERERADIERDRADALQQKLNEEHSQIERAFDLIEAARRAPATRGRM